MSTLISLSCCWISYSIFVYLVAAAQMAVERVNEDRSTLSDYQLTLIESDSGCESSWVLRAFTEYMLNETMWPRIVGGLGNDTSIIPPSISVVLYQVAGLL